MGNANERDSGFDRDGMIEECEWNTRGRTRGLGNDLRRSNVVVWMGFPFR